MPISSDTARRFLNKLLKSQHAERRFPPIRRDVSSKNWHRPANRMKSDACRVGSVRGHTMGLDVALVVVILIAAIRGWLQGFLYQVIRIGGLIACVYLAAPVRDQAKPYVATYLPVMPPDLVDQILWCVSASVTYIVIVGAATLALKMTRRPEIPGILPQRSRHDQFAGFLLGIAKGGLVGAFLVAALDIYGSKQIALIPWADQQAKSSLALRWNEQYHPAARIWHSAPVRHFVSQIQRMGSQGPAESSPPDATKVGEERPVVQTARKAPSEGSSEAARREDPQVGPPAPPAPHAAKAQQTDPELEQAVEEIKSALDAASKPK
jgi:uncharacterized membrane protein required for colicin V production